MEGLRNVLSQDYEGSCVSCKFANLLSYNCFLWFRQWVYCCCPTVFVMRMRRTGTRKPDSELSLLECLTLQAGTCCGMQGREWERDPETRHEHVCRKSYRGLWNPWFSVCLRRGPGRFLKERFQSDLFAQERGQIWMWADKRLGCTWRARVLECKWRWIWLLGSSSLLFQRWINVKGESGQTETELWARLLKLHDANATAAFKQPQPSLSEIYQWSRPEWVIFKSYDYM